MPTKQMFSFDQRIVNMLMFKSDFVTDPGLFYGKMGLVIFFAHYCKLTSNQLYEDIADELMECIIKDIHHGMSIGLGSGLSGIGWGIEYLIQHQFMDGDNVEICEKIDCKIMETDPRRLTDLSLNNGLEGLLHYILAHMSESCRLMNKKPFDSIYLYDIYHFVKKIPDTILIDDKLRSIISKYIQCFKTQKWEYKPSLSIFLNQEEMKLLDLSSHLIGLKNGYAGSFLNKLLQ